MESILQGWLTKSPPEKKQFKLFGSKWRKRYFVLYAPPTVGGILDAYTAILEYYTSKKLHHKCGTINLTDCEEVLSNLDSEIYKHVFGLRTMHKHQLRTYYLAAETEAEMNKWVYKLCQVLGLTENDDNLGSPPSQFLAKMQQNVRLTQPVRIPDSIKQPFARPLTSQPHFSPSGLQSPAPPPPRPGPTMPSNPFTRLNISEPNLLEVVSPKSYPECRRETTDFGGQLASPPLRMVTPPGSSRIRNAESFPELDRFSPTTRKPGNTSGEGREFMELPPIPPEKTGTKVTCHPGDGLDYDLPKQKYYEHHNREEQHDKFHEPPSKNDLYNSPPSNRYKPVGADSELLSSDGRLLENASGWYNVPQTSQSSDECYKMPKCNAHENHHQTDSGRDFHHSKVDSDDCYNVPKSQLDKRKHTSQGEELNNIPKKSQPELLGDFNYLSAQRIDRRSYNEQKWLHQQQISHSEEYDFPKSKATSYHQHEDYNMPKPKKATHDLEEDYDVPKSKASPRDPEEDYDVPKSKNIRKAEFSTDVSRHEELSADISRPQCFWERKSALVDFSGQQPNAFSISNSLHQPESNHGMPLTAGFCGNSSEKYVGSNFCNVPPALLSIPTMSSNLPPQKLSGPTISQPSNQQNVGDDMCHNVSEHLVTAIQQEFKSSTLPVELHSESKAELENTSGDSSEIKKTPSGTFKQHKASVQSSSSLHKKQVAAGIPIHDSIRFTQRTKSFKRSIPSQDRSALPLPVKRIVERSESSSSSVSDDEDDNNSSVRNASRT